MGVVLGVVSPRRLARGRGCRLREPRALRCRPGHREARLDADDVIAPDERPAVVVLDRLRARLREKIFRDAFLVASPPTPSTRRQLIGFFHMNNVSLIARS